MGSLPAKQLLHKKSKSPRRFAVGAITFFVFMMAISFCSGCSKLKKNAVAPAVHPTGWLADHAKFMLPKLTDVSALATCQSCHGTDFKGGSSGISCVGCHNTQRNGRQCIACHGGGGGNTTGAPPVNVAGRGDTVATVANDSLREVDSTRGVGAHRSMVLGRKFFSGFDCAYCHVKPEFVIAPGHVTNSSGGRGDVVLSQFASLRAQIDTLPPAQFSLDSLACQNVYCHGNFRGGNNVTTHFYRKDQALCGSCHDAGANPAALGGKHGFHVDPLGPNLSCATCHDQVVTEAIPPTIPSIRTLALHVNGLYDIAFNSGGRGYIWDPAAKTCGGSNTHCHRNPPTDLRNWYAP